MIRKTRKCDQVPALAFSGFHRAPSATQGPSHGEAAERLAWRYASLAEIQTPPSVKIAKHTCTSFVAKCRLVLALVGFQGLLRQPFCRPSFENWGRALAAIRGRLPIITCHDALTYEPSIMERAEMLLEE